MEMNSQRGTRQSVAAKGNSEKQIGKQSYFGAFGLLALALCISALFPSRASAAFGLTSDTNFYTVDTGAIPNLAFKIRRTDNGSSTQSAGDIASLVYNGVEYQDQSRGSQINGGFDYLYNGTSAVAVSATVIKTDYIKVTVQAGNLTHYYLARRGYPNIYMATYFSTEPDTLGLCRFIVRMPSTLVPNGPTPSDIRNTDTTVESGDIFGFSATNANVALRGQTRSKHYSNQRLIDWNYIGATGPNVGVWMVRDNNEGNAGGPFYRSLLNQCGSDQEITYILNYGEAQTEAFRVGVLNGPYVLAFTNGAAPALPIDTSWIHSNGIDATLTGWVQNRGYVTGQATGIPSGFQGVVGFANATAQYWCIINNGNYTSPWMIPGTYTMTLYKGELAVATDTVTVPQSVTPVIKNIASTEITPNQRWRIGEWDGTPAGFLNADKVTTMHPSDVRMSAWGPVTYTIGSSSPANFPCYQWKDVNNPTTIKFNLTAGQVTAHTLRIGLTCAYSGARPQVSVNGWTSAIPSPSTQPSSRTLTVGTYRGNNVTYTYNIPASAFVAGLNTMYLSVVSGSGGTGFLSPGYSYDAVELDAPFNGTYRITPQHAQDKAMDVFGANPNNSTQIDIYTYTGGANQQFLLDQQSDGSYRIRTALAGNRCVELPFGDASNGSLIKLWDDNGNSAQRWNIVPIIGEWVKIVPKNDATKCMDVAGFGTADGTLVQSWDYLGGTNQLWRLTDNSTVAPSLKINDATVTEGAPGGATNAVFTATLSAPSSQIVTVDFTTANGTTTPATAGSDYTATTGTLTFNPGETTKTIAVPVTGDSLDENNETFFVNLSNPVNVTFDKAVGLGTITDDDPTSVLTIDDINFTEGTGPTTNATFTVTLSPVSGRTVTANYTTADGTGKQPGDYNARSGTVTFLPGQTTQKLTIGVIGDAVDEDDEFFKINLSGAVSANIGDSQGVCTIVDNDTSLVSINDVTTIENDSGPKNMKFTVRLSTYNSRNVTVDYVTADNTATAGSDYVATAGTVIFNPGQTIKTFIVQTTGDLLDENNESYLVNLSNATNAVISDQQGVGTIKDNDLAPSLSIANISIVEGNSGTTNAVFTVTLSAVSGRDVSVKYATANGSAAAGSDYTSATGTVNIPAGQLTGTISVPIIGDVVVENNETVVVNLSGAVGANIADAQGICTITNDDASN